jgi:hypothetical protein
MTQGQATESLQPSLSLCMIVRNESHFPGRCLAAVRRLRGNHGG